MQCVSGPVTGNYSGTGAVNLSLADANPPYRQRFSNITSMYPVDENNVEFEGNSGEEQSLLTVECHSQAPKCESCIAGVLRT